MVPRVSSRSTEMRVSVPPCAAWAANSSASVSMVTAFAATRPPGRSAPQAAASTPDARAPPPTNTASGTGSPDSAAGASPMTSRRPGTPSDSALRAARAARSGRGSMPMARLAGWQSIHSMPMEPEPAQMSNSS